MAAAGLATIFVKQRGGLHNKKRAKGIYVYKNIRKTIEKRIEKPIKHNIRWHRTGNGHSRGFTPQLEETDGHTVLFSARGEPSVIFEMANPVQQLCTDAEQYLRFQDVLSNLVQTLGEGYALQKQDIFLQTGLPPRRAGGCGVPDAELLPLLRGKGVHRNTHLPCHHAGSAARPVRAV